MSMPNDYVEYGRVRIYEGAVVQLVNYPKGRWILCNGWYPVQDTYYIGWYFKSIPDGRCISVTRGDILTAKIISSTPFVPHTAPIESIQCEYGITDISELYYDISAAIIAVMYENIRYVAIARTVDPDSIVFLGHNGEQFLTITLTSSGWGLPQTKDDISHAVQYIPQELTEEEQAQARENIGVVDLQAGEGIEIEDGIISAVPEIVACRYGETEFAEIADALSADKICIVPYDLEESSSTYHLTFIATSLESSSVIRFIAAPTSLLTAKMLEVSYVDDSTVWRSPVDALSIDTQLTRDSDAPIADSAVASAFISGVHFESDGIIQGSVRAPVYIPYGVVDDYELGQYGNLLDASADTDPLPVAFTVYLGKTYWLTSYTTDHSSYMAFLFITVFSNTLHVLSCALDDEDHYAWTETQTRLNTMVGASEYSHGYSGFVPEPGVGKQNALLRGDGTWVDVVTTEVQTLDTYNWEVTTNA